VAEAGAGEAKGEADVTKPGEKPTTNECTRRDFLRWAALAGAVVAAAGSAPFVLASVGDGEAQGAPGRARRWTMLIDLRRCDGCGKCAEACRAEHNVPKGQEWLRVYEREENGGTFFLPRPCMHCENAPCLKVCPVGATFRSKDGLILIDEDRCIGCRYCMAACPYDARSFNWSDPAVPEGGHADLSPTPARGHGHHRRGVVEKCTFCAHRCDEGRLPACVEGCPMKAIYFGDANEDFLSNGTDVIRLSSVLSTQESFRWKEELGTEPRVYYLPARR